MKSYFYFFKTFVLTYALIFSIGRKANAGELKIGIVQEWSSFNPVNNQLASNEALFSFIIRKITKKSATGEIQPDLAESIPTLIKNEKHKFVAVWEIKKNARWGDGQKVTCADWKLGWQAGLNPKVSVEARSVYEKIESIAWSEKTPKTCEVTYVSKDWSYDRDLPPLLPSHLEKPIYEKQKYEPEGYDRNSLYVASPLNKGLYNGPYVISEFKIGSHIILTKNTHFFGPSNNIPKIIIKHIPDSGALKANLLSGQINMVSAVGLPPDTALQMDIDFSENKKSNLKVRFQNSAIIQGVYFNLDNEIFKDPKVREALSRAIDKEKIVKAFFNNKLLPAEGILSPQHPAFEKTQPQFSLEAANKALDQSGWIKNSSGLRQKYSKTLVLTFKTSAGLKVLENIQIFICEEFKKIGAKCNIKNEPPRTLLGQSVPRGEFDLAMFGQPIPPDTSITSYFSKDEIPTSQNSWAGGNQIRLRSKEVDQLLSDFDQEFKSKTRHQIVKKIENEIQLNHYLIPLYHRKEAIVLPKKLTGLEDSFDGTSFVNPENWQLHD